MDGIPSAYRHLVVRDPGIARRRKVSGLVLNTVLGISEEWDLTPIEQRGILGWPTRSALARWSAAAHEHRHLILQSGTFIRACIFLAIYARVRVLFKTVADQIDWLRCTWFSSDNIAPLSRMVSRGKHDLMIVHCALDEMCRLLKFTFYCSRK
jgi:hypothetical protein